MTTSEKIDQIAGALAKAQGELQNVTKDAQNPHFKSDYATLDAITDTVRPVFTKHGLAVVQMPAFRDGIVIVETLVTHTSGQWIAGEAGSPIPKLDPQGVGSATTYLRRYSLAAIAALAQTDDDGNVASQKSNGTGQKAQPTAKKPDGFDNWMRALGTAAAKGTKALREVYAAENAKPFRQHLAATNAQSWEDLKTAAEDADRENAHAA